jgi:hypothetical protein
VIGSFLGAGHSLPSVDLGVDGEGGTETQRPSNFCFEGRGNAISLSLNPGALLDSLFAGLQNDASPQEQAAIERLRRRNESVLDAVRDSFVDLAQGLGAEDRRRLEEHAARLRQLEVDLSASASCSVPEGLTDGVSGLSMSQIAPQQIQLLAHAMGCDIAPVGRIEFINQQGPRFGIETLDSALAEAGDNYDWHSMVHGDPFPGTSTFLRPGRDGDVPYDSHLLDGYRFFVEQFASLLGALDAIAEGPETSVLDNSLVILASDLGEGLGHGSGKMGYVLAGNLGSARRGYHFDAGPPGQAFAVGSQYYYTPSAYNVNQLLNSMLDMAGVVDSSGNAVTMGLGGYLEGLGKERRIEGLFA